MSIQTYIISSLEDRINKKISSNIMKNEPSLLVIKKSLLEVAVENILLTENQDDLVDDFGFLLDHLEKSTDFTLISKVKMYNIYIQKMTRFFNLNVEWNNVGWNNKKIKNIVVPNFTHEGKEFQLIEEKDQIIFTHGYDALHSGKEAAIALFQYIDSNLNKERTLHKVKGKE
ncbi:MAG: hypothetical protein HFJ12_07080 [Bacilli bacterium]|nr:hypothetical protein [Bacilli bacterium]